MRALGLVNGRLVSLEEKVIPIEDRGHQFGDGVYEVTEVYNGKVFTLKHHMDRLFRSLNEIRISIPYTYEELCGFHELLIRESGITEGAIYLQITRGVAPRVHNFPESCHPGLSMTIRPGFSHEDLWKNGVKCITHPDERWLNCHIKSLNLLGSVLCKQKAQESGSFEVVLIRNGYITESAHSNFFVVKDGKLWTHPANKLILKGITRTVVLENIIGPLGVAAVEEPFDTDFLNQADEAFLTATTHSIIPVVTIDDKPVGNGKVGPITRKLQAAFLAFRERECAV